MMMISIDIHRIIDWEQQPDSSARRVLLFHSSLGRSHVADSNIQLTSNNIKEGNVRKFIMYEY
jgi:hypothetical protein